MPAIEMVAERGSVVGNNTSETSTLCDLPAGASVVVGNYLIARVAGDNSGTSGAARTLTISDPRSNTWTVKGPANRTAGVASDGASTWIAYAKVVNAYSDGDDITFNYSGAIVAKAINVEEFRSIHSTSPEAVGSTTTTGSSTTPSISRTPTGVGQLFYGALGIEGLAADTYTQDTDVVDGAWHGLTSRTGGDGVTAATSMTVRGAYKITGVAAQTWNPTITSRDWAQIALVFDREWPAGIKGVHVDAATSSVGTWDVTISEDTVTGDLGVSWVGYNPTTQDCPTPTGWTLVGTQNISASARLRFYKRTMATTDASTALTFTNTTSQRLASGVIVFDGTVYSDVDVFASANETVAQTNHTSPTTAALNATGVELNIIMERSSSPSVSVTSAPSGSTLEAFDFGQGSGSCSGAFAVDLTTVAAGASVGGGDWVLSGANAGCAMVTLALSFAAVNATPTPTAVAATAAIPAPTAGGNADVTAATVTASAAVPAPTIQAGSIVTPATVTAVASVPSAVVAAGSVVTPGSVAAVAAVPARTMAAGSTVTLGAVTAVAGIPTPSVSAGGSALVTPSSVSAVASVPARTMVTGSTVTATAVTASAAVPARTMSTGSTVTAISVQAVAAIPAVQAQAGSRVTPSTVTGAAGVPAPTVRLGADISRPSVVAVASVPTPGLSVSVLAPVFSVAGVATIPTPTVVTLAPFTPLIDPVLSLHGNTASLGVRGNNSAVAVRPNQARVT